MGIVLAWRENEALCGMVSKGVALTDRKPGRCDSRCQPHAQFSHSDDWPV